MPSHTFLVRTIDREGITEQYIFTEINRALPISVFISYIEYNKVRASLTAEDIRPTIEFSDGKERILYQIN